MSDENQDGQKVLLLLDRILGEIHRIQRKIGLGTEGQDVDQADGSAMGHKALIDVEKKGATVVTAAERSTRPTAQEICKTEFCNRPAFESTGYCCDNCQRGENCSPTCSNQWTDWSNRRGPTDPPQADNAIGCEGSVNSFEGPKRSSQVAYLSDEGAFRLRIS